MVHLISAILPTSVSSLSLALAPSSYKVRNMYGWPIERKLPSSKINGSVMSVDNILNPEDVERERHELFGACGCFHGLFKWEHEENEVKEEIEEEHAHVLIKPEKEHDENSHHSVRKGKIRRSKNPPRPKYPEKEKRQIFEWRDKLKLPWPEIERLFKEKFPDSNRSLDGIQSQFYRMKDQTITQAHERNEERRAANGGIFTVQHPRRQTQIQY